MRLAAGARAAGAVGLLLLGFLSTTAVAPAPLPDQPPFDSAQGAELVESKRSETQPLNLLRNPGFEEDPTAPAGRAPAGWSPLWTREAEAGVATLDVDQPYSGKLCLRVEHRGVRDWSFGQAQKLTTTPDEVFQISGWVACEGVEGQVNLSVIPYDAAGKVITWFWGTLTTGGTHDWRRLERRFVAPTGCRELTLRLTGSGPGTAWFDDLELTRVGSLADLRKEFDENTVKALVSDSLSLHVTPATGAFSLTEKPSGRSYTPIQTPTGFVGLRVAEGEGWLSVEGWRSETGRPVTLRWELVPQAPEMVLTLTPTLSQWERVQGEGEGEFGSAWSFPPAFSTQTGQWLVVPLNEGILYPVDDASIEALSLAGFSGHGLSMAWYGMTEGGAVMADEAAPSPGLMTIVETPDDMLLRVDRLGGEVLVEQPVWLAQKGEWGSARRLRYVLLPDGGYVAQAKRYREYARSAGRLVTLREKARANPNVDRLIGAVNVWTWQEKKTELVEELQQLGLERVLFSNAGSAGEVDLCNRLGYLSSRYDNYQDVYPPGKPPWGNHVGWPQDLVLDARGDWVHGWEVRDRRGNFQGGVRCSVRGLELARRRIPEELAQKRYLCRFIDTTTASAFKECYDSKHPATRSDDKRHKMELLRYMSEELKLVTGSETGIDCAVPYVHYFEGMLSLGPYRLPDAGRHMIEVAEPTEAILKFQVGHRYRVPLWELVYHDCVVSQWYWGDYNNKIPQVWDRRDLWNRLYGTPPMWMFNEDIWEANRKRFLRSHRDVCPLARQVGYEEMVSHKFLTPDHAVQRTRFGDGTVVTVNFGDRPYRREGITVPPGASRVEVAGDTSAGK